MEYSHKITKEFLDEWINRKHKTFYSRRFKRKVCEQFYCVVTNKRCVDHWINRKYFRKTFLSYIFNFSKEKWTEFLHEGIIKLYESFKRKGYFTSLINADSYIETILCRKIMYVIYREMVKRKWYIKYGNKYKIEDVVEPYSSLLSKFDIQNAIEKFYKEGKINEIDVLIIKLLSKGYKYSEIAEEIKNRLGKELSYDCVRKKVYALKNKIPRKMFDYYIMSSEKNVEIILQNFFWLHNLDLTDKLILFCLSYGFTPEEIVIAFKKKHNTDLTVSFIEYRIRKLRKKLAGEEIKCISIIKEKDNEKFVSELNKELKMNDISDLILYYLSAGYNEIDIMKILKRKYGIKPKYTDIFNAELLLEVNEYKKNKRKAKKKSK